MRHVSMEPSKGLANDKCIVFDRRHCIPPGTMIHVSRYASAKLLRQEGSVEHHHDSNTPCDENKKCDRKLSAKGHYDTGVPSQ